jgi:hypothetical protein
MDEKSALDRLPSVAHTMDAQSIIPVAHTTTNIRTRRRRRFFHLCLVTLVFYYLFWMPFVDDEDENHVDVLDFDQKSYQRNHLSHEYHFEKHMQADVDRLVAGSLESR